MESAAVIIPSFGDRAVWDPLEARAVNSVKSQTAHAVLVTPRMGPTVSQARNIGALHVGADWLIFLDADDELDPRYVEEMLAGEGDIRQPSTLGVINGVEDDYPVLIPPGPNFMAKNHLIIGCMVRRDLFIAAGGFRDLPVLEDWDLWIRLRLAGATVGQCPKAVYRVHVRPNSRNQDVGLHARVFQQIQDEHSAAWFVRGLK